MLLVFAALLVSGGAVPLNDENTPRAGESCGYVSCPKTEKDVLNVHIVPHTHDDVGWLKTVDQYYYGSRNNIQKAGVQYILDSVISELWEDPKRRFIYVETAFFWKWWQRQSALVRHKVHVLVRQGRLEFISGAWSMNDEAATHYQSTIDQFTHGLRILNDTFGECGRPRVGWQIDPFGHAREFASILAGMRYDGLFLGRIDYQDKRNRLAQKAMEMVWRGDDDLGKSSDIFTGVLFNTYSPPPGFCFDVLCSDEPIIDDDSSPMHNVDLRIEKFLEVCNVMSEGYRTKNILITMGEDFHYQDAKMWFKNLDKLVHYTNLKAAKEGLKIKLFYSTPSCYLKAVKDANPTLPTKQDDFFPYASDSTAYWTGYFTSRPTTKYFERQANAYLQIVKQLQILAKLEDHSDVIQELSHAMGVMQHHDAITGTEKQHVTHDYERLLTQAVDDALIVASKAFQKLSQSKDMSNLPILRYERCEFNQSQCKITETSKVFVLTVYNPLSWKVTAPVKVPVVNEHYLVYGPDGKEITSQIVKLSPLVINIPTRKSKATHELVFMADSLPPLGYRQFYIKRQDKLRRSLTKDTDISHNFYSMNDYWKAIKEQPYVDIKSLEEITTKGFKIPEAPVREVNEKLNVNNNEFKESSLDVLKDSNYGVSEDILELEKIIREARKRIDLKVKGDERKDFNGVKFPVMSDEEMRMLSDDPMIVEKTMEETFIENEHYKLKIDDVTGEVTDVVMTDGSEAKMSASLVYYKGCVGDNSAPEKRSSGAYIFRPNGTKAEQVSRVSRPSVVKGAVLDRLRYEFEYGSLELTLYKHPTFENIEFTWTVGIDIADGVGKEVALLYRTDIGNGGEFHTDSNGRQMIKRKLGRRPQYNVTLAEPVAGNYYPVTNRISIEDGRRRLTVLTDRAQGGTSLEEGHLELMLHRRLLHDDAFGVGEALNETAFGKGLVARGSHYVSLTPITKDNAIRERTRTLEHHLPPQVFVSDADDMELDQFKTMNNEYGSLKRSLPSGLHLLTLEPWRDDTLLLRLENYLEKADGEKTNVEVDVSDLFVGLKLISLEETNLAANQWLKDSETWDWRVENEFSSSFNEEYGSFLPVTKAKDENYVPKVVNNFKIELAAKEIRTFVVKYEFVKE